MTIRMKSIAIEEQKIYSGLMWQIESRTDLMSILILKKYSLDEIRERTASSRQRISAMIPMIVNTALTVMF